MSRFHSAMGNRIGEDFFYVQEVSYMNLYQVTIRVFDLTLFYSQMRSQSVGYTYLFLWLPLIFVSFCRFSRRRTKGVSIGIADGVGGWVDSGVDPSMFSQALMYHAHRYAKDSWAGEPETDPMQEYEEREQVEGWELYPAECLELAHGGVLRERAVQAGQLTRMSSLSSAHCGGAESAVSA